MKTAASTSQATLSTSKVGAEHRKSMGRLGGSQFFKTAHPVLDSERKKGSQTAPLNLFERLKYGVLESEAKIYTGCELIVAGGGIAKNG